MNSSLAATGHRVYQLLGELSKGNFHSDTESEDARSLNEIIQEGEKFKTWAVSMGLLVYGHGSLDYRVREAESLAQTLNAFLQDLVEILEEVMEINTANNDTPRPKENTRSTENTESINEDDENLTFDDCYVSVQDIINRLLRLSVRLRNPSTRLRSSKAQTFSQYIDDIDLFQMYEAFDLDYVDSMFQLYRGYELDDSSASGLEGGSTSTSFSPGFLVRRIARANATRRRQFAYWRHHQLKLEIHTNHAIENFSLSEPVLQSLDLPSKDKVKKQSVLPLSVTTATQLQPDFHYHQENESTISISEYMPSPSTHTDDVSFPPPPHLKNTEDFFHCPYCFTTCARRTAKVGAWKAHLIHDLRPYICTYEICNMPDQMYDSKVEWAQHESSCHQLSLESTDRTDTADTSPASSYADTLENSCPICYKRIRPIQNREMHIATHLERLAMFSLPRSIDTDPDRIDKDSGAANVGDDGTQHDTLSLSLAFGSIDIRSNAEGEADGELHRTGILSEPVLEENTPTRPDIIDKQDELSTTEDVTRIKPSAVTLSSTQIHAFIETLQSLALLIQQKNTTMINFYIYPTPTPSLIAEYNPRIDSLLARISSFSSIDITRFILLLNNALELVARSLAPAVQQLALAVDGFQNILIDYYDESLKAKLPYLSIWQQLKSIEDQLNTFGASYINLNPNPYRTNLLNSATSSFFCRSAIALINDQDNGYVRICKEAELLSVNIQRLRSHGGVFLWWNCDQCAFRVRFWAAHSHSVSLRMTIDDTHHHRHIPTIEYRPSWLAKCHLHQVGSLAQERRERQEEEKRKVQTPNTSIQTPKLIRVDSDEHIPARPHAKYGCVICYAHGHILDERTFFPNEMHLAQHLADQHGRATGLPLEVFLTAFKIAVRGTMAEQVTRWDLNLL